MGVTSWTTSACWFRVGSKSSGVVYSVNFSISDEVITSGSGSCGVMDWWLETGGLGGGPRNGLSKSKSIHGLTEPSPVVALESNGVDSEMPGDASVAFPPSSLGKVWSVLAYSQEVLLVIHLEHCGR
jgi:hypothetical protein